MSTKNKKGHFILGYQFSLYLFITLVCVQPKTIFYLGHALGKMVSNFPSPAGMSLAKVSLTGNNFPAGKFAYLFLQSVVKIGVF
jgi:hypothetical protein